MISVIVPVYNTAPYLKQCVDSLLNQTYKDIEVFLIDDGSTDDSGKICDEYARKDSRIIVIHQKNQGVSAARNVALEQIHGNWVCFIDSDDWLEDTMFEKLLRLATKTNADIAACDVFDEKGDDTSYRNYWNVPDKSTELIFEDDDKLFYGFAYSLVLWNKLICVDLIRDIRFSTKYRYGEDSLFLSDAIIRSKRVGCIGEPLYHYRSVREGNVVSATYNDKLFDLMASYDEICEKLVLFGADLAIGQIVYTTALQVLFKLPLDKCVENYYVALNKFIKKYKEQMKRIRPNYRVSAFRLMLVRIAAVSPRGSVMIWKLKLLLQKRRMKT